MMADFPPNSPSPNSPGKPIRILVHGGYGKMGTLASEGIRETEDLELAGRIARGERLERRLEETQPDVFLDFTAPEVVLEAVQMAIDRGISPVIGTSGLTPTDIAHLSEACRSRRLGAIVAPNFSLGAMLLMKFSRIASRFLGAVEILELHHDKKRDAPSFTALRTAAQLHGRPEEPIHRADSPTSTGTASKGNPSCSSARGHRELGTPIHSVRLPGLLAHQEVLFGRPGETLSLRHDTLDRSAFLPGILLALRKVRDLDHLLLGLENLAL